MIDVEPPSRFRGAPALPLHGVSLAYTLDHPQAATQKKVQYFETLGDRAIWSNGWKAVARHERGRAYEDDIWELYHAAQDFSETKNLADSEAGRLQDLIALWKSEAERYDSNIAQPRFVMNQATRRDPELLEPLTHQFAGRVFARHGLRVVTAALGHAIENVFATPAGTPTAVRETGQNTGDQNVSEQLPVHKLID